MAFLGKTKIVVYKLKQDIEKLLHVVNVIVSLFFIGYYCYSIYINIDNITFLVINSIFLFLGIFGFILYLVTYKKNNKNIKIIKNIIGKSKYLTKVAVLIINTVNVWKYGGTLISKILLIVSAITIISQLLLEIIKIFIFKYVELFNESIHQDLEFVFNLSKIKESKGNFFEMLDAPLEKLANKLEGKEKVKTKGEKELDKLVDQYGDKVKELNDAKKAETKARSEDRAQYHKEGIKEHLKTIKNNLFNKNKIK